MTESMQAIVICFVYVCSVIGTVGIIHNIKKYHLHVWGWACSGALKYWSAAELGFRIPIYNTKRAAVERAQSRINTFERAAQCHADLPTHPEEDHIFKRPYLLFLKTLHRSGVPRIPHSYSLLCSLITPLQMHL